MPNKIAADVAEAEFLRFTETMDLDVDKADMDEDDARGFEKQKARIIKALMAGSLVINDDGEPVFTPCQSGPDAVPITFHEPTGASLMAMDGKKKNADVSKMFSVMGNMTKTSSATFSKMVNRDLNVCLAVTTLFLG